MRVLLIICLLFALPVHAKEMFRWVDENGKVHFSDEPPEKRPDMAEEIEVKAPPKIGQDENVRAIEERTLKLIEDEDARENEEMRRHLQAREDVAERMRPRCAQARRDVKALSGPVKYRNKETGELEDVSEARREQDLQRIKKFIAENCAEF